MASNQPDAPEIPGLASLRRLFAKAVGRSKFNSAGDAYPEIKKAAKAGEKLSIIEKQFAVWQQGCVSAIEKYFPQYVELGCKYHNLLKPDPVEWAAERTWEVLGSMCGVKKLGDQESHSFVSARWWFGMATEFNPGVKMPGAKAWLPPRWLTESRSLDAMNQLFQKYLDRLSLTFYDVLDEEKERARLRVALNRTSSSDLKEKSRSTTVASKPSRIGRKKILTKAETLRREVILCAIEMGRKGQKYCKFLDEQKLPLPRAWIEAECPATKYVDAYKAGGNWRKRIQDEKSRYQRKYGRALPRGREQSL